MTKDEAISAAQAKANKSGKEWYAIKFGDYASDWTETETPVDYSDIVEVSPAEDVYNVNYAKYPVSIAEIRSKTGADWTPRDALISALRDIDSGELNAQQIVIVVGNVDENHAVETSMYHATPNRYVMLGLVNDWQLRMASGEFS